MTLPVETSPLPSTNALRDFLRVTALAAFIYIVYALGMLFFNHGHFSLPVFGWAIIAILSTVLYLVIIGVVIRLLTKPGLTAGQEGVFLFLSLLLFLALNPVVWQVASQLRQGVSLMALWSALEVANVESWPLIMLGAVTPLFLIFSGVFFGRLVSRMIREMAILLPVALVAALIDFWGVYWGVVATMSENAPVAVSSVGSASTVAASVPEQALTQASGTLSYLVQLAPPDAIGIGDFVFFAFFLACAYRLGFSAARTMWGVIGGLFVACAIMALDGQTLFGHDIEIAYLPGLVFISAGIILANLRAWKLTRHEWLMTLLVVAVLAVPIGYSITRQWLDKPRDTTLSFSMSNIPDPPLTVRLLQRLREEERPRPAEVRALAVVYLYACDGDTSTLQQYQMLALGLAGKVSLRNSRQYAFVGQLRPQKNGALSWQFGQRTTSPPDSVLKRLKAKEGEEVTALRNAKSVPVDAHRLLDHVDAYRAELPKNARFFVIYLLPDGGELRDETGALVRALPYK